MESIKLIGLINDFMSMEIVDWFHFALTFSDFLNIYFFLVFLDKKGQKIEKAFQYMQSDPSFTGPPNYTYNMVGM